MTALKLAAFTGETPRIVPRLIAASAAQSAIDTRLDDGSLTPYRAPESIETLEGGPFSSIYLFDEEWLAFEGHVHFARGPVADERLYYTGDEEPKILVDGDVYPLAVPRPTAAPTATPDGLGAGDVITRVYCYTFVTAFGEESEPSAPSNEVEWQPGKTVVLSDIEDAPSDPDRNITKQRFYRSQSGQIGTDFYFIAERDVGNGDFTDDVAVDAFAEPLPSRHWNAPPDELQGLIPLPNGMMAAFVGRKLYFSEPYRPHAWPEIYVLTTDVPIVALAAMGTMVMVLTEGVPYRVIGSSPDAMVMEKMEANLPCINAHGVVDLGHAVAWPTHEGLAVARGDGAVGLATGNIFSPDDWRALNPQTMRAGPLSGRWIGSYSATTEGGQAIAGSLIIDIAAQSFLIRSSIRARAWHHDLPSGNLYFLQDNTIKQFDAPSTQPLLLYWKSKQFVLSRPDNFGCILVEARGELSQDAVDDRNAEREAIIAERDALIAAGSVGGELAGAPLGATTLGGDLLPMVPAALSIEVSVGVYADGVRVVAIHTLDHVARLPSGFKARIWEVDVASNVVIDQVVLGRTTNDLKQVPSQ